MSDDTGVDAQVIFRRSIKDSFGPTKEKCTELNEIDTSSPAVTYNVFMPLIAKIISIIFK